MMAPRVLALLLVIVPAAPGTEQESACGFRGGSPFWTNGYHWKKAIKKDHPWQVNIFYTIRLIYTVLE
jgi:hypothetical protein